MLISELTYDKLKGHVSADANDEFAQKYSVDMTIRFTSVFIGYQFNYKNKTENTINQRVVFIIAYYFYSETLDMCY